MTELQMFLFYNEQNIERLQEDVDSNLLDVQELT